jgi:D-3-phosphoglycerate dehydrogenase
VTAGRIVRFDSWVNPVFDERLRSEAGIDYQVHPMPTSQAGAEAALNGTHVYHVSAAKDEIPPYAFVTPGLIAACPTLLCASSSGAGFDTIDVAACTRGRHRSGQPVRAAMPCRWPSTRWD